EANDSVLCGPVLHRTDEHRRALRTVGEVDGNGASVLQVDLAFSNAALPLLVPRDDQHTRGHFRAVSAFNAGVLFVHDSQSSANGVRSDAEGPGHMALQAGGFIVFVRHAGYDLPRVLHRAFAVFVHTDADSPPRQMGVSAFDIVASVEVDCTLVDDIRPYFAGADPVSLCIVTGGKYRNRSGVVDPVIAPFVDGDPEGCRFGPGGGYHDR